SSDVDGDIVSTGREVEDGDVKRSLRIGSIADAGKDACHAADKQPTVAMRHGCPTHETPLVNTKL
ncbi:MAG TPA: hypothetical protein VIY86_06565, partial [Pirellulaceae bacterium]